MTDTAFRVGVGMRRSSRPSAAGDAPDHTGGGRQRLDASRRFDDRGAALVELALLLPFLAVMVFGTIDVARAYNLKNRVTNAAREGAWYGQMNPKNVTVTGACTATSSIVGAVKNEDRTLMANATIVVTNYGPTPATAGGGFPAVITGCGSATVSAGHTIEVKVTVPMPVFTPFISNWTGNPANISGTARVVVMV